MLTVDQVVRLIQETVVPVPARAGDLLEGGVLAQDIQMDEDSPRFDRSQLDGFAVRSADAVEGAALALAGQIDAGGQMFPDAVAAGTRVGINTGGVVPAGADAILMVEHAEREVREGREFILVKQGVKAGNGIQKRGSDARAGEVILLAGTRLRAAQQGLCAAAGVVRPMVRKVRIAVLSTGDELVDIETPLPLPEGKIRNSNQVMLCGLGLEAGGELLDLGTCRDEAGAMRAALGRGLAEADLLVVCGGMSMGTRDLVPGLLKELGVVLRVEKVRIKPGKPFVLGTREAGDGAGAEVAKGAGAGAVMGGGRKYVAGLPGNPVSAFVTFQRFVREMVRRMEGSREGSRERSREGSREGSGGGTRGGVVRARVDRGLGENGDREFYMPCVVRSGVSGEAGGGGGMVAEVLAWRGSADVFTLGRANGLIIQDAGSKGVVAGGEVEVLVW